MGSLQSEVQERLGTVRAWCEHAEGEVGDLCWEESLVHSITLSQAARQLYTQHSQIAIAYGPLPAAAAAADAVDAFERSLGELLQAQQAAVEALSSALVGAAEDALTRAAEGREKVNATTPRLKSIK